MATFHFDLVSPEKLAFSGEVDQVDVPGIEGDFGVLAGHAPVVAAIRPGILTVTSGGTQQKIIVLGGLGSVRGTLAAALILGIVESFGTIYLGKVLDRNAIAFAFLILVLMVRPQGLFAVKGRSAE